MLLFRHVVLILNYNSFLKSVIKQRFETRFLCSGLGKERHTYKTTRR